MVEGLRKFLERHIEPLPFVDAIFPGVIKRKKGATAGLKVKFQYPTKTGAKLLALSRGCVQEVFVVTQKPEKLKEVIEKLKT